MYPHVMKFIICLLLFLGTAFAAKECPVHTHLFLIHGIAGSEHTFGSLGPYLAQVNKCYRPHSFVYATGESHLTTQDFASELTTFIDSKLAKEGASVHERISFIMHSQGGIIGSLWLHSARTMRPDLFARMDAFITLSTPYWGASMAKIGDEFFYTLPEGVDNPLSPMGRKELQGMSYGSPTVDFMERNFDNIFLNTHVRFLAIGGLKRNANPHLGEDDATVSAYSSNPNHYSYDIFPTQTKERTRLDSVPFIPVRATHLKLDLPGVARVEKACLLNKCRHPSLPLILKHLKGLPVESELSYEFRKYRVHVFIHGWEGKLQDEDDWKILLTKPHGEKELVDFELHQGKTYSTSLAGILKSSGEKTLRIDFLYQEKLTRSVKVKVQGGLSTFVHLYLPD
jgi:pimeloyl-ACP methyl ester carboxylesterase